MAKLTGTNPDQVPTNADLGTMAYQDKDKIKVGTIESTTESGAVLLKTGDDQYSSVLVGKRPIGDNFANIEFDAGQSNGVVKIEAEGSGNLRFYSANNPVMTMLSSGNVQISGDLTGVRTFDVYNTGSTSTDGAVIRLITEQAGSTSTTSGDLLKRKNGEFRMVNYDTDAAAYIAFNVGSSERMKIASNGEVQITSGLLELNGNDIGGTQVTIADDAVASITPPRNGGFMTIILNGDGSFPLQGHQAMLRYDVGSSLAVSEAIGAGSIDVSTSDVSGTTGTDGNTTVAVQTGVIKIENRSGSSGTYQITFL